MSFQAGVQRGTPRNSRDRAARFRSVGVLLFALSLGACASAPENPLTAQQRASLGINEISVELAPDASIWWGEAERDFAASKGCHQSPNLNRKSSEVGEVNGIESENTDCDYDAIIASPEAKAYLEARAIDRLTRALEAIVEPAFAGQNATKLSVKINWIHIVSGGQAMLLGGEHMLNANFEVSDLSSGKSLAQYENLQATAGYGLGGVVAIAFEAASDDPYDRLSVDYAEEVKDWLKAEEG